MCTVPHGRALVTAVRHWARNDFEELASSPFVRRLSTMMPSYSCFSSCTWTRLCHFVVSVQVLCHPAVISLRYKAIFHMFVLVKGHMLRQGMYVQ